MSKNLEESKKMSTLLKLVLLQTKKPGKEGKKSGAKGAKKAPARGSKGRSKKNWKSPVKQEPRQTTTMPRPITFSHPSSHGSCGCWVSMYNTVSSIPQSADWPVSFPLQSEVEHVSATGLQLETMVSRLSLKLGDRLAHCEDSYRKIGTSEGPIDIIRKGYKPT